MKKLLLLLFFLSISANAQFGSSYPPFSQCDDNNDQYAVFDLNILTSMILAAVVPSQYSVTYHDSFSDALNNTNLITNPNSYVNIVPAVQTLGIRITNNSTSEVNLANVDLVVNLSPTANPDALFFCDMMELPNYDLSSANNQITGGDRFTTRSTFARLTSLVLLFVMRMPKV